MAKASLKRIVAHCDEILKTGQIPDYKGAVNGLQVENDGTVRRIAAAVDATLSTIRLAVEAGADLLVVHHGLFWGKTVPWTGRRRTLLKALLDNNLSVYSAHLPLDLHPRLGNNAQLCKALGLRNLKTFFPFEGCDIGLVSPTTVSRKQLASRLARATGAQPLVIPGGPSTCRRIGVVTGGAGSELEQAARAGVDTFISGEGPHHCYALAEDLGLNVLLGGHYATETFGVKALAATLSKKFKVPWTFVDYPTGL